MFLIIIITTTDSYDWMNVWTSPRFILFHFNFICLYWINHHYLVKWIMNSWFFVSRLWNNYYLHFIIIKVTSSISFKLWHIFELVCEKETEKQRKNSNKYLRISFSFIIYNCIRFMWQTRGWQHFNGSGTRTSIEILIFLFDFHFVIMIIECYGYWHWIYLINTYRVSCGLYAIWTFVSHKRFSTAHCTLRTAHWTCMVYGKRGM